MVRVFLSLFLLLGSAALADPLQLPGAAELKNPSNAMHRLLLTEKAKATSVRYIRLNGPIGPTKWQTADLTLNNGAVVPSAVPINLRIDPLASHLAFAALEDVPANDGFSLTISNNLLGVGLSEAFGARIGEHVMVAPFVALDYNRVDSDRLLNVASPRPFASDNADTGLTLTTGASLRPVTLPNARIRPMMFAAFVAGSDNIQLSREAGSIASQIIQSIGNNGPEILWGEIGVGTDYQLSRHALVRASLIQTIGHPNGDAVAAQFMVRAKL